MASKKEVKEEVAVKDVEPSKKKKLSQRNKFLSLSQKDMSQELLEKIRNLHQVLL